MNKDIFRQEYTPITPEVSKCMLDIKIKAQELYDMFDVVVTPNNIEMIELARTNLEQSVMWGIKGLTTPSINPLTPPTK